MIVFSSYAPGTPLLAIVDEETLHPAPRLSLFASREDRGGMVGAR
jgi:hypothetical protein